MLKNMFVDRVTLKLIAGKGGNGVVAWRREKYIPKGGPTGGNGGVGGSVILKADPGVYCLDAYKHKRRLKAEDGGAGGPNQRQGRQGKDLYLQVPCGTLLKDVSTGHVLCDMTEEGMELKLCLGGRGGRGNASFRSSTHRAPNMATPGKLGQEMTVELELKLIADVGLVGYPNAGKSTLIREMAHLEVKTAAYPFTTLKPNLGFLVYDDFQRLLLADIPGIIEGASCNRGLGLEFLRHIERTRGLIYMVDASGLEERSPWHDFEVLRKELAAYGRELLDKPFFVALNKCDCPESLSFVEEFKKNYPFDPATLFEISALTGEGLDRLKVAMRQFLLAFTERQSK